MPIKQDRSGRVQFFNAPPRFISDGACDDGGCPRACAVDPQPMVVAPWPRRAVATVPRSGVVVAVPWSVAATPWSRGRATARPLCGQAATSPGPRGGGTFKAGEQAAPLDVRVTTVTHEARGSSERRSLGGPSDDLHLCLCHRRHPPATTFSDSCFLFDYCVLCLPHVLFTLKIVQFYAWTWSSYISLLHAYFLLHIGKAIPWFMLFVIIIKNQTIYVRKCQICTSVIKLSLIPACS
jgi:hypothetical protein